MHSTRHHALVQFRPISGRYFASECVVTFSGDFPAVPLPHQNIMIATVCLSMPSNLPSHAFFLDAIEEIYDKNASLSIYPKKYSCTSMRGL